MIVVFWVLVFIVIYTYFLYLLILVLLKQVLKKPINKKEYSPTVSILISAHNEEDNIENKINNLLAINYPKDKVEILLGSDGSTDKTNEILEKVSKSNSNIKSFIWSEQRGKASIINELVKNVKGEILIFNDTRQTIEKNAIKELVNNFNDEKVGCVSGELVLASNTESPISEGIGLYWSYELHIRELESQLDSMIGATGAIYAIRRGLISPIPESIILDDLYIPLMIVKKGYRAILDKSAKAFDQISVNSHIESARKVRTLVGNWQLFIEHSWILNPFKNRIAFQVISHKLLRVIMPYLLIGILFTSVFLLNIIIYKMILFVQIIFYLFAFIGKHRKLSKDKIFSIPYAFCLLNIMAIKGLYYYLTNKQKVAWKE